MTTITTLYYWKEKKIPFRVGHISLNFKNGPYISHFPNLDKNFKQTWCSFFFTKEAKAHSSLLEDIEAEGSFPDEVLEIPDTAFKTPNLLDFWFDAMKHTNYHLLDCNCSHMVLRFLELAGMNLTCNNYNPSDYIAVIKPDSVFEWVKNCVLEGNKQNEEQRYTPTSRYTLKLKELNLILLYLTIYIKEVKDILTIPFIFVLALVICIFLKICVLLVFPIFILESSIFRRPRVRLWPKKPKGEKIIPKFNFRVTVQNWFLNRFSKPAVADQDTFQ